MSFFDRILTALSLRKSPPPAPRPAPVLTRIGDELIDLAALSPAELQALEARITAQVKAREAELSARLHALQPAAPAPVAKQDFANWVVALRIVFGPVLAEKLSQQDIEPGMQVKHLVASCGPATEIKAVGEGVRFIYGDEQTGSYYDVLDDTIVGVHVVNRPPPPVAFPAAGEQAAEAK